MRVTRVSGGSSVVSSPLGLATLAKSAYGASAANVVIGGNYTGGARYYTTDTRKIRGVIFFWKLTSTNAETIKLCLWDASGTLVTSTIVAVQTSAIHVALF